MIFHKSSCCQHSCAFIQQKKKKDGRNFLTQPHTHNKQRDNHSPYPLVSSQSDNFYADPPNNQFNSRRNFQLPCPLPPSTSQYRSSLFLFPSKRPLSNLLSILLLNLYIIINYFHLQQILFNFIQFNVIQKINSFHTTQVLTIGRNPILGSCHALNPFM